MSFISMFVAGAALIVVLIGLFLFLVALVMDIICIVRASVKKKNHVVLIIFTVLLNIGGFLLFVLPVAGMLLIGNAGKAESQKRFENAENKVYVENDDTWRSGFTYGESELVHVDFLASPKDAVLTEEGVIVLSDEKQYYVSSIKNESGYQLYQVEKTGKIYCDKDDFEAVRQYYYEPTHLESNITKYHDGQGEKISVDFDAGKVFEIRALYDTYGNGVYDGDNDELGDRYSIIIRSKDGLFAESISIYEIYDHYVLGWKLNGSGFSAIYLTDELEDYLFEKLL